ncbi:helix-turn-helix domain-containing protein [Cellulomonas palmilytica]|uniref:hypothetical protein n=1 Tax=Cellulomonas palmilytica TaxID=2608402 RepID=UPI001F27752C|nr:hypothetical protein [Cellulomonas palmilytica]UJP39997.1 hypothetical protein F1D97_00035 [Cellulomonas palmilytica]
MSPDDHKRAFLAFVAGMLADMTRYLDSGDVDVARDGVGFRHHAMYLSDDELAQFVADLRELVLPRLALPPDETRTRRLFSTVLVPLRDAPSA